MIQYGKNKNTLEMWEFSALTDLCSTTADFRLCKAVLVTSSAASEEWNGLWLGLADDPAKQLQYHLKIMGTLKYMKKCYWKEEHLISLL